VTMLAWRRMRGGIDAAAEQDRRAGVAQVVEADLSRDHFWPERQSNSSNLTASSPARLGPTPRETVDAGCFIPEDDSDANVPWCDPDSLTHRMFIHVDGSVSGDVWNIARDRRVFGAYSSDGGVVVCRRGIPRSVVGGTPNPNGW
jgi:hypothetical protein